MDVDIGGVHGGVPQGDEGHVLALVQQGTDVIGDLLIAAVQHRPVPHHGGGAVEKLLPRHDILDDVEGGLLPRALVGNGHDIGLP